MQTEDALRRLAGHELDTTWPYKPYAPCPCGRDAKAKFCCRVGKNAWFTSPRWRPTDLATTKVDNDACFARGTGTCCDKMTAEHYISHSVLGLFGQHVRMIGGRFPESKDVSIRRLTAKILCERHNSALSPLDATAKVFFGTVDSIVRSLANSSMSSASQLFLMNGGDIEYVLLKMLCGLAVSGAVKTLPLRELDPRWPQILFKRLEWPSGWGLYVEQSRPGIHDGQLGQLQFGFKTDHDGVPVQMGLQFAAWHLLLHASDHPLPGPSFRYRSDLLVVQKGRQQVGTLLSYDDATDGGFVRATLHD